MDPLEVADGIYHIPEYLLLPRQHQQKRLSTLKSELLGTVSLALPVIATYLLEMIPGKINLCV